jgi:hypothetical protein
VVSVLAGLAAWIGASVIVLADGRRALAAGLATVTVGLAGVAWRDGDGLAAVVILLGGGVAAFLRQRAGPPGWMLMPAGSTPRLILCVAGALVALWFAASITVGPEGAARFAVLCVAGLAAARILSTRAAPTIATALATLVLAMAVATHFAGDSPGMAPYLVAALLAAAVMFLPVPAASAS